MQEGLTYQPTVVGRVGAALRLDLRLYREVSTDVTSIRQAFLIVLLSGLSTGLGLGRRLGGAAISAGIGAAILGWFLWALVILIVARAFGHHRNGRSLLRALGFANAPSLLLVLGIIPVLGNVARIVVVLWLVAATAVAVQAVYDVPRRRAAVIALVGFVAYLALGVVSGYYAAS
jgi:hypothetical protein